VSFLPLPAAESLTIGWPTPNRHLFTAPEKFFARTRVNPDYGKPGFTRDCGQRFHRGCDIGPVFVTATGRTTTVVFTDCATGQDFPSDEPTFVPHDDVFAILEGRVAECVEDATASDFGKHVLLEHRWPGSGEKFYTLYGHLAEVPGGPRFRAVRTGDCIGRMGQTSRLPDARNWMAIAPHLHFEVRNAAGAAYDPVEFLRRFLSR
jgi:hypothetical protein